MKTEELREKFKNETGLSNWDFGIVPSKYTQWLEEYATQERGSAKERYDKANVQLRECQMGLFPSDIVDEALKIAAGLKTK